MNELKVLMYHQQKLQIMGISVPGTSFRISENKIKHFRFFRLHFLDSSEHTDYVPFKIPIVPIEMTPYEYKNNILWYKKKELTFENIIIERDELPLEEDKWHYKGYTFPFDSTRNKYIELRINPKLSGNCPGKCFFCHRWHSYHFKPEIRNSTNKILSNICHTESHDVFSKIKRIVIISEMFGNENKFLDQIYYIYDELLKKGYPSINDYNSCSTEIRSLNNLIKLYKIVKPKRYSFSLEFFKEREKLMGKYKGLPIDKVYKVLSDSRRAGFSEIQINYLAGIDSLETCKKGFENLLEKNLVDSVGLSTFTCFNERQKKFRIKEAWHPSYYEKLVSILNSLNIKVFNPESYDMRTPYTKLLERI